MQVYRNVGKGIISLRPSTAEESKVLREIASQVRPGTPIRYIGRSGAQVRSPYTEHMVLHLSIIGADLYLATKSTKWEQNVRLVRDAFYFGGSDAFVVSTETVGGKPALNITIAKCKDCGCNLIEMGRCQWRTCETCARTKCEHHFDVGAVMDSDGPGCVGVGEYCSRCGENRAFLEPDLGLTPSINDPKIVSSVLGITFVEKVLPQDS